MRTSTAAACAAVLLGGALLSGCDGGDGNDGAPPVPAVPFSAQALVANAGPDAEIPVTATAQRVVLDASKSFFRTSSTTTRAPSGFLWSLLSAPQGGTLTGIPSSTSVTAVTFTAEPIPGTYTFRVTASEAGLTTSDDVSVIVKPFVITPIADRILLGFTLPAGATVTTSIAATLAGTVSGTPQWSWSGVPAEPFFKQVAGTQSSTLTFGAPRLAEVEGDLDDPEILGLWYHAGGYHRLTVTAQDGAGNTDSEDVIVSFGVPTSGLDTVPLNVPVYLNGGTSRTGAWTYTLASAPAGSAVTFFRVDNAPLGGGTDQQVIYFIPKVEGLYSVVGTRTISSGTPPATTTDTNIFNVTAARFVSDGQIGTIAPNPDLGQCAGCHGGSVSFLDDKATEWRGTAHARQAEGVFDPANPTVQARIALNDLAPELARATTGFFLARPQSPSFTAANDGFDDLAGASATGRNVPHRGLALAELETRFPEAARLAQVQCETCHGPGSLHFGDSEAIAVTVKVDSCARCHVHEPAQWSNSAHADVVLSPSENTSCVRCHTAQGAIDPRAVAFRYPATPPSIPVPEEVGRQSTATCATCHDPHDATNPRQLRVHGNVTLPDGTVVAAGDAASCFHCHNSRRSFASSTANRNDAHPGVQGDMVAGVNGAEFPGFTYFRSAHSDPARFVTRTGTPGRWCVTCHMAEGPAAGQAGHDELGGHSFAMRSEAGKVNSAACGACHVVGVSTGGPRGEEFNVTLARDWDGDGVAKAVQNEVAGLFARLGGTEPVTAESPFGLAHEPTATAALLVQLAKKIDSAAAGVTSASGRVWIIRGVPGSEAANRVAIPASPDGEVLFKALWNYYYVLEDLSVGIHNTGYAVGLLQSSIQNVEAALNVPQESRFNGVIYAP